MLNYFAKMTQTITSIAWLKKGAGVIPTSFYPVEPIWFWDKPWFPSSPTDKNVVALDSIEFGRKFHWATVEIVIRLLLKLNQIWKNEFLLLNR